MNLDEVRRMLDKPQHAFATCVSSIQTTHIFTSLVTVDVYPPATRAGSRANVTPIHRRC